MSKKLVIRPQAYADLADQTLFIGMGNMAVAPTPLCCFYRATETGIEILRILHGARDLPPLLEDS